jgi:hypothetical protein
LLIWAVFAFVVAFVVVSKSEAMTARKQDAHSACLLEWLASIARFYCLLELLA